MGVWAFALFANLLPTADISEPSVYRDLWVETRRVLGVLFGRDVLGSTDFRPHSKTPPVEEHELAGSNDPEVKRHYQRSPIQG